ncbi:MAG: hypothetical protein WCK70_19355, partial [Chloroflexales bacterium]
MMLPLRFIPALALTALLLALALRYPVPQRIDVGTPGDAYFLANFYPAENESGVSTRWSAPGARLLLPAFAQGLLALTMRLHAAPFAQPEDLHLDLVRSGRAVGGFGTKTGWRIYRVLLAPGGMDGLSGGQAALDLSIPSVYPGPADPRPLGVALDWAELRPLGPMPLGPVLERALLLTWALGMVGMVGVLGQSRRSGESRTRLSPLRLLRPYAVGAGLSLWAWRDPGGYAWAVPNPPLWLLVAGTLIILLMKVGKAMPHLSPLMSRVSTSGARLSAITTVVNTFVERLPPNTPPSPPASGGGTNALSPPACGGARGGDSNDNYRTIGYRLSAIFGVLLVGHLALLLPLPWRGLGALVVLGLPGWLVARVIFPAESDPLTQTFLGLCGAIAVAPLITLALQAIPGPLPGWLLLLVADILSAVMIWQEAGGRRQEAGGRRQEAGGR